MSEPLAIKSVESLAGPCVCWEEGPGPGRLGQRPVPSSLQQGKRSLPQEVTQGGCAAQQASSWGREEGQNGERGRGLRQGGFGMK